MAASAGPDTPFLLLDRGRIQRNIARLQARVTGLGATLRPHLKTAKSLDVARLMFPQGVGPITVSTLAEAKAFAAAGYTDILYAVGIAPAKLPRVAALRAREVDLVVLLDNAAQARAVVEAGRAAGLALPALIEVDCDGCRGGIPADSEQLLQLARMLMAGGAELRGIVTHAGESYFCPTDQERAAAAENERRIATHAAARLRAAGPAVPVVSMGSTPTAFAARDLSGITEVRAGVYVFFDLMMAGLGVCTLDDIALSVVTTVIGHRPDRGWIMTDAGWTALSSDGGISKRPEDRHFGLVATRDGRLIDGLAVLDMMQEHGVLGMRPGSRRPLPDIAVGTPLRILPVHACATAFQHDGYHIVAAADGPITAWWPRIRGW